MSLIQVGHNPQQPVHSQAAQPFTEETAGSLLEKMNSIALEWSHNLGLQVDKTWFKRRIVLLDGSVFRVYGFVHSGDLCPELSLFACQNEHYQKDGTPFFFKQFNYQYGRNSILTHIGAVTGIVTKIPKDQPELVIKFEDAKKAQWTARDDERGISPILETIHYQKKDQTGSTAITIHAGLRSTLKSRLRQPPSERAQVNLQVAMISLLHGLAFLHANNCVLVAIDPEKILVNLEGETSFTGQYISLPDTLEMLPLVDNIAYASPEAFRSWAAFPQPSKDPNLIGQHSIPIAYLTGSPHELGKSSDIWSLGCVFYEMLLGHPPLWAPALNTIHALKDVGQSLTNLQAIIPDLADDSHKHASHLNLHYDRAQEWSPVDAPYVQDNLPFLSENSVLKELKFLTETMEHNGCNPLQPTQEQQTLLASCCERLLKKKSDTDFLIKQYKNPKLSTHLKKKMTEVITLNLISLEQAVDSLTRFVVTAWKLLDKPLVGDDRGLLPLITEMIKPDPKDRISSANALAKIPKIQYPRLTVVVNSEGRISFSYARG